MDSEILESFCAETHSLLEHLIKITNEFEETNDVRLLEDFGQIMDRIMGAAYTLNLQEIGRFCELGKKIGYKASQTTDKNLVRLAGPILADGAEILLAMVQGLIKKEALPESETLKAFRDRLKWFLDKFQDIDRETTNN